MTTFPTFKETLAKTREIQPWLFEGTARDRVKIKRMIFKSWKKAKKDYFKNRLAI